MLGAWGESGRGEETGEVGEWVEVRGPSQGTWARGWDVLWLGGARQVAEEREFVGVLLNIRISFPLWHWNYLLVPRLLSLQQCWDWITCVLVWTTLPKVYHVYIIQLLCHCFCFSSPAPGTTRAGVLPVLFIANSPCCRTGPGPWQTLSRGRLNAWMTKWILFHSVLDF